MNEKGNRYALAALKERRGLLAAEIVGLERQVKARKESLAHVDATLKLLDPSIDVSAIAKRRVVKRIRLFRQGELGRLILGALRDADRPLGTHEIVDHVVAAGGHRQGARKAMTGRVRGNLQYLLRRGSVTKSGDGRSARWDICDPPRV